MEYKYLFPNTEKAIAMFLESITSGQDMSPKSKHDYQRRCHASLSPYLADMDIKDMNRVTLGEKISVICESQSGKDVSEDLHWLRRFLFSWLRSITTKTVGSIFSGIVSIIFIKITHSYLMRCSTRHIDMIQLSKSSTVFLILFRTLKDSQSFHDVGYVENQKNICNWSSETLMFTRWIVVN